MYPTVGFHPPSLLFFLTLSLCPSDVSPLAHYTAVLSRRRIRFIERTRKRIVQVVEGLARFNGDLLSSVYSFVVTKLTNE